MGDARRFYINSLSVEDAASTSKDPTAPNSAYNQEVDQALAIEDTQALAIEYTKRPETVGAEQSKEDVLPPEVRDLVGLIICKECGGVNYFGTVVSYNVQRKWFRIEYDDEGSEDMEEQDVRRYLAAAIQMADQIYRSRMEARKQKPKTKRDSRKRTTRKPGCKNDTSGRSADGTYIPLAFRTTKKDEYYWY